MRKPRLTNLLATFALLLTLATPTWAATVGQDNFNGTPGLALTSHTPDVGATWSVEAASFQLDGNGARLLHMSTGIDMARKGDAIGDDEMDCTISGRTNATNTTRRIGVCARMTTADFGNAFCAYLGYTGTQLDVFLTKEIAGAAPQQLGTYAGNLSLAVAHTLKLKIRSGSQAVDVNAVTDAITATEIDTTLQGNQYCGVIMSGNSSGSIYIEDFLSESVTAAPTERRVIIINQRFGFPEPKEWLNEAYRALRPAA